MPPAWAQRQEAFLRDGIVSPDVFDHMVERLRDFAVPDQHALETKASQRTMHLYLAGLLSHCHRKNAETRAALVDVERLALQECIGTAPWTPRPWLTVLGREVGERWGDAAGIIAFAPSRVPKRGTHSVGVFMGYVARHAHALLDFRLALPPDWARDSQRRQACHVPEDVVYHTRPAQGLERLDLWRAQVPHGGVVGDDEVGRHRRLREQLRERGECDGLGGPCPTTLRALEAPLPAYQGRGRRPKPPGHSVTVWRHALAPEGGTRLTVRDGEKGPVAMEMVTRRVQTRLERKRTGPDAWLVGPRCPLADAGTVEGKAVPDARDQEAHSGYRYSLPPTCGAHGALEEPSLGELARVIKAGTCIEASFQRGKGAAGMDASQVRPWEGGHHRMTLTLIAVWCLSGETHRGQQWTPALTRPQVRDGRSVLLLEVCCPLSIPHICRHVQRQ